MGKCIVLVNSCDKYEDAWHPFFRLFDIMWPSCPYEVYLNTETKECNEILNMGYVKTLHPRKVKCSWSRRLSDALQQIQADYVITFLEDFFLMSPVKEEEIRRCIDLMDNDRSIAGIEQFPNPSSNIVYVDGYNYVNTEFVYCINTMTYIWRKSYLLSILKNEDAWDFELYGSIRYRYHRDDNSKVLIPQGYTAFDYSISPECGYGIYQGKYLNKNKELFEKYGIVADFSKREIIEDDIVVSFDHKNIRNIKMYFVEILNNPKKLFHYLGCLKKLFKYKIKSTLARYFNI